MHLVHHQADIEYLFSADSQGRLGESDKHASVCQPPLSPSIATQTEKRIHHAPMATKKASVELHGSGEAYPMLITSLGTKTWVLGSFLCTMEEEPMRGVTETPQPAQESVKMKEGTQEGSQENAKMKEKKIISDLQPTHNKSGRYRHGQKCKTHT